MLSNSFKTSLGNGLSRSLYSKHHRCMSTNTSNDDQYIQKSKMPSMHFQPSLPRLPIPELSKTCARYLRAQRPLLDDNEYSRLEKIVKQFEASDGAQLQKELVHSDSQNKHTSYISGPWFDMYLKDRKPLPLNYNPGIVIVNDPKQEYNHQLIRSTNLLISSLKFMRSLRENILEPEVFHLNPKKSDTQLFRTVTGMLPSSISWYGAYLFKAFPLDMSQYQSLFNTTRIPKKGRDELYKDYSQKHIIVMKGGNFYSLQVLDESGAIIDFKHLYGCLKYILNDKKKPAEFPIGLLTTTDRDEWADTRVSLSAAGNEALLKAIDGSIFMLNLDQESPDEYKSLTRHFLHADGCNRWFDKCFSLIVAKNGSTGINFEHSWGDGVAVLRYITDIYKNSTEKPYFHPDTTPSDSDIQSYVKSWDVVLTDGLKQNISKARKNYEATVKSLDINVLENNKMGRKFAKSVKISPDSIVQLAFQLGQYKLNGKHVGTYESCSTAAFKHGRTETMRPCTIETAEFCKALLSSSKPSKDQLRTMIAKCSDIHSNLVKEAAMGQGFDRHLFALRTLAEKSGKVPDIFRDKSYEYINTFILSTSTLSSDIILVGGFGPVVLNGYGLGYFISNERIGVISTSYNTSVNGADFMSCLSSSLDDIHAVLS